MGWAAWCGSQALVQTAGAGIGGKLCSHRAGGTLPGNSSVCSLSSHQPAAIDLSIPCGKMMRTTPTNDPRRRLSKTARSRCGSNHQGHGPGAWGTSGGIDSRAIARLPQDGSPSFLHRPGRRIGAMAPADRRAARAEWTRSCLSVRTATLPRRCVAAVCSCCTADLRSGDDRLLHRPVGRYRLAIVCYTDRVHASSG